VTRGEKEILNFVTSHFKKCIKAILQVSTKLKQFHRKALNIPQLNNLTNIQVMTFNVQFDVASTHTRAGISFIWDYLINEFISELLF